MGKLKLKRTALRMRLGTEVRHGRGLHRQWYLGSRAETILRRADGGCSSGNDEYIYF
jgi:hypothetical protein